MEKTTILRSFVGFFLWLVSLLQPEDPAGLGSRIYQLIEANVSGGNNVNQVYSETQYNAASQGYNEGQYNTPSPGYNEGPYNAAGQVVRLSQPSSRDKSYSARL